MEPDSSKDLYLFNIRVSIILWIGLGHVKNRNANYQKQWGEQKCVCNDWINSQHVEATEKFLNMFNYPMEVFCERITLKICIEASHAKKINSSKMHWLNIE